MAFGVGSTGFYTPATKTSIHLHSKINRINGILYLHERQNGISGWVEQQQQ